MLLCTYAEFGEYNFHVFPSLHIPPYPVQESCMSEEASIFLLSLTLNFQDSPSHTVLVKRRRNSRISEKLGLKDESWCQHQ